MSSLPGQGEIGRDASCTSAEPAAAASRHDLLPVVATWFIHAAPGVWWMVKRAHIASGTMLACTLNGALYALHYRAQQRDFDMPGLKGGVMVSM